MFKSKTQMDGDNNSKNNPMGEDLDDDISIHIFSSSATLVGVCLTVIGIFKAILHFKEMDTFGDELLAVDALLFLVSCILSYFALRTRNTNRHRRIEKIADGIFLFALILMALACGFITYAFV